MNVGSGLPITVNHDQYTATFFSDRMFKKLSIATLFNFVITQQLYCLAFYGQARGM